MSQAKTAKEVLAAVEWLLENVGWCRQSMYQDKDGRSYSYHPDSDKDLLNLRKMCLLGALDLVDSTPEAHSSAMVWLRRAIKWDYIIQFNDSHDKAEVLAAVRKAKEST